jgi:hypothetical protein
MSYIKIENHHNLLRHEHSNAIINSNMTEYENYISNYNRMRKEQEELNNLKNNVSSLHSDVQEIKSLLKLLIKEKIDDN